MQNLEVKSVKARILAAAVFCCFVGFLSCGNEPQGNGSKEVASQPGSLAETGKAIFQQNCSSCHLLKANATGPALQDVLNRWDGDSMLLKAFVRNPSKLIAQKEPHALKAYQRTPVIMTAFPNLSDAELNALIAYFQSNP